MNLTVICLTEVNAVIHHNGIALFRKAIVWCSLAPKQEVCWQIKQLLQHQKDIIHRYPMEFARYAFSLKILKM